MFSEHRSADLWPQDVLGENRNSGNPIIEEAGLFELPLRSLYFIDKLNIVQKSKIYMFVRVVGILT